MVEFLNEILEWPVIVQGALGSALFSLVFTTGQRVVSSISNKYAKHSRKQRVSDLRIESLKYSIITNKKNDRSSYFSGLIYMAVGRMIRGLIWLVMGLMTESIIPVFGVIGFIGALYYLFQALNVFKPIDAKIDVEKRLEKIKAELRELGEA